ncbi:16S rRNA methyltransferase [Candidatus Woesearchaeota archaeon]|jgi:16S rRNA G1207 methylase RsmC|nr:16S rRNA methyltransferase [Candidatus Woesearchaeota archaeon]|tara:strand:+ start:16858 stop:17451 length:594 start_codon:yes stop_codon:yes gene_type:complete
MEHYYSEKQKSSLKLKKINHRIKGINFEFYTSSGVFSKNKIDKGTLILAENMIIDKDSDVLDIGCGIGILGIAAAKLFSAHVIMSDVNQRAVMLSKKNIKLSNIKASIFQGNLYEPIKQDDFDVILANPPQTAGKEICFALIEQSKDHLKTDGNLQLVARHNKGGKSLSGKMQEVFGNVKVIAKKSGYSVYLSEKIN